jgi:hypothetical protein
MLDAHLDQALEDGDCVFGNELLKGDQERSLNGDAAADLGETVQKGANGQFGFQDEAQLKGL